MRLDEIYDTACEMNEIEKNKSIRVTSAGSGAGAALTGAGAAAS